MNDPVLHHILEQMSVHDLARARASSERAGDQDLVALIERRLEKRRPPSGEEDKGLTR